MTTIIGGSSLHHVRRRVRSGCRDHLAGTLDRASGYDIIELRLGDVDWRGQTISLVQQKTGNPLTVPLIEVLTSTLADYVLHERPEAGDDHVFLRRVAPHVRLRDHAAIHGVTATVFTAAGVTDAGRNPSLRHNAASRMLRAATPLPTIAAVLGHAAGIDQAVHEHRR